LRALPRFVQLEIVVEGISQRCRGLPKGYGWSEEITHFAEQSNILLAAISRCDDIQVLCRAFGSFPLPACRRTLKLLHLSDSACPVSAAPQSYNSDDRRPSQKNQAQKISDEERMVF
jgi:hypothetical protein